MAQGKEIQRAQPIDIQALQETHNQQLNQLRELTSSMISPSFVQLMGELWFGSKQKTICSDDGTPQRVDWSMKDILNYMEEARRDDEKSVRQAMTEELQFAMGSQWMHFRLSPSAEKSNQVVTFVAAILQRVLASDEEVSYPYPWHAGEVYYEAELLEVIRRTILKPSYLLIEGIGKSGIHSIPAYHEREFWDSISEKHRQIEAQMQNPGDRDEFYQLQKQQTADTVEAYRDQEWREIIELEEVYIGQYLSLCARRALYSLKADAIYADAAAIGKERVYPDKVVLEKRRLAEEGKVMLDELAEIKNSNEILSWIKKKFGPGADYQTLLQALNPIKLGTSLFTFKKQHFIG